MCTGDLAPAVTVSVVLLSKNEPELAATLDALRPQIERLGAECIVVDASDHLLDHIRDERPWVRWVGYEAPLGSRFTIPQQRNLGVRVAAGDVIAFCDAGGMPDAQWLEQLTAPIIGGVSEAVGGPVRASGSSVYKVINDLPDGAVVDHILTANFAFTRSAFDRIGGFDERYEYGSDVDFAWRLQDAGIPTRSASAAVMGMHWGSAGLQRRRAWRYGKARARLFRLHPQRRATILRRNPEILAYPVLIAGALVAPFASVALRSPLPLAWFALPLVFLFRNRRHTSPVAVLADHAIYAWSFLAELARGAVAPGSPLVLHSPNDPGPYQPHLIQALTRAGVPNAFTPEPTRSKSLNLVLLPFTLLRARAGGTRIWHIHWVHDFGLNWANTRIARRVLRSWFSFTLLWCRCIGIEVVWTAHNLFPHTPVFDDDLAARRRLVSGAAAVIAHTEDSARKLRELLGAEHPVVIAQGATPPPATALTGARERVGVPTSRTLVSLVGRIEPYKGVLELLDVLLDRAGELAASPLTLVIAGAASDDAYATAVTGRVAALRDAGCDVRAELTALSEETFWDLLAAADVAVFPFLEITNSGSVIAALSAGTPALTTDLPAFAAIDTTAIERVPLGEFTDALLSYPARHDLDGRRRAAREWSDANTWEKVATATRSVYLELSEGQR